MVSQAVDYFGSIDVLVNNAAGGIRQSTFIDANEELWEQTYKLNITSVLLCSQAVLKYMMPRKKGKIINISSAAARIGGAGESIHYAATPNDDRLTRMSDAIPIKRIAKPIEIAECIAFLSSDASNYILGEIINVSGGR